MANLYWLNDTYTINIDHVTHIKTVDDVVDVYFVSGKIVTLVNPDDIKDIRDIVKNEIGLSAMQYDRMYIERG